MVSSESKADDNQNVYSFVADNAGKAVEINMPLDLKVFINELLAHKAFTGDYLLESVGFGTETFRGEGVFYVKEYTLEVVYV